MTIGQRIAAKRKEKNLSQEALGEALGVSRQAIYKWESDASLPEIEKLIALSRLFGVSVGWLLGVEEEQGTAPDPQSSTAGQEEFSETQLRTIEELLKHYLKEQADAAPRPEPAAPAKHRRWPYVLAALLLLFLLFRIEQLKNQYETLQNSFQNVQYSLDHVSSNVASQIRSLTDQVEDILKSQNNLTADYSAELTALDPGAGTVSFTVTAVPKTYTDGMEAIFVTDSSGVITEAPGIFVSETLGFTEEITCSLSDSITISVIFQKEDVRETQVLERFYDLNSGSFPYAYFVDSLFWDATVSKDGITSLDPDRCTWLETSYDVKAADLMPNGCRIVRAEVGIFCDRQLITWATPCEQPSYIELGETDVYGFFRFDDVSFPVEEGKLYCLAARVTDNYGRTYMFEDAPYEWKPEKDRQSLTFSDAGQNSGWTSGDPADWNFEPVSSK